MARRLAAILAADVVGFSRLMADDEAGTLALLKQQRKEHIDPITARYGGRLVKLVGDGALVEFSSVVDAVQCALDIQQELLTVNSRISLRIGVNLGDVLIDGDDIYGDGVNVAARLEALAEPGGIAIAGPVYDQVRRKIDAEFTSKGITQLKNISDPIEIWHWSPEGALQSSAPAAPVPASSKPSIAVLPFTNMSGDPDQEYLADGIAEDILTGLARARWLVVTSRNSSFVYKGKNTSVRQIARELGVTYVLEGSVRIGGNRARITAQLIDASTDRHIWAERYDGSIEDIFELQDKVTEAILGAIEPELGVAEQERARRKPPDSLDAWDLYLRGQWHLYQFRAEDNAEAQRMFRQSISVDPNFAASHTGLAYACHLAAIECFTDELQQTIQAGIAAARKAVSLDDKDAMAFAVLARILTMGREYESAIAAGRAGVSLNPNIAQVRFGLGFALALADQPEEALAELDEAVRISPRDPNTWSFLIVRSWALCMLRRFDEAAESARQAGQQPRSFLWPMAVLACALGHLGKPEEARAARARFEQEYPQIDIEKLWSRLPFRNSEHKQMFVAGVRAIESDK
jgi:adenylate cyclase